MLRGIRLVIYDLDGTLIDSTEAIVETLNTILRDEGVEPPAPGVIEALIGEPMPNILRALLPPERHVDVQHFWDAYIPVYARISPEKTRILPGVTETLTDLQHRGLKQTVATQKKGAVATRVLRELDLLKHMSLVLGIDDVAHPKPAPDIIELTLKHLSVRPEEAVFVDDTVVGLTAGKNAGVHTVGVTTGPQNEEKLSTLSPDYVIHNMSELRRIISL
jgi:phosphoglycolate phosphatase